MKTKIVFSLMALLFLFTTSLQANDPPTFDVVNQKGSSVYKLVYKAPGQNRVNVKILDDAGFTLYNEALTFTNGFTYPMDFNGMSEGTYTVEISSRQGRLKKSLVYDVKNPMAYVHVAKQPEDKYMLTIKSEVPSNFTVRIYDRWNQRVVEQAESVNENFGLIYNLSKVNGPFTFEVTGNSGIEIVNW